MVCVVRTWCSKQPEDRSKSSCCHRSRVTTSQGSCTDYYYLLCLRDERGPPPPLPPPPPLSSSSSSLRGRGDERQSHAETNPVSKWMNQPSPSFRSLSGPNRSILPSFPFPFPFPLPFLPLLRPLSLSVSYSIYLPTTHSAGEPEIWGTLCKGPQAVRLEYPPPTGRQL